MPGSPCEKDLELIIMYYVLTSRHNPESHKSSGEMNLNYLYTPNFSGHRGIVNEYKDGKLLSYNTIRKDRFTIGR